MLTQKRIRSEKLLLPKMWLVDTNLVDEILGPKKCCLKKSGSNINNGKNSCPKGISGQTKNFAQTFFLVPTKSLWVLWRNLNCD